MTSDTHSVQRFLRTYYAYTFLYDFMLCYAIYTALFELRGLSATQIGGLIAFWSAAAILLEVPSGALSDRFDRRWLLVVAPLIKVLTFVFWGIADGNVWLYGLGFFCWSASSALSSGTGEALLYERLEAEGQAHTFGRVLGQVGAAEAIGIGAGLLIGGFVAAIDMELTVWLSIPPLFVCSLVALQLRDVRRGVGADEAAQISYLENFRIAFGEFVHEPALRTVTLYVACGLIVFEVIEEFEQLYYLAVQLPIWLYGVAGAAALAANAGVSVYAHHFEGTPHIAWSTPLLGGALFIWAGFGDNPAYVLVLLLAYIVVIPVTVLSRARFQALLEGRSRATTTSFMVVAQNIVGVVITIAFGALADAVGIRFAYAWAGLTMVPLAIWTWRQQRRGRSPIG